MKSKWIVCVTITMMLLVAFTGCVAREEMLDQENPHIGHSVMVYVYGDTYYAQSFMPTMSELTRIELYCQMNTQAPNNLTVSIRDNLLGPDLAIVEMSPMGFPPRDWIEFDFEPNIVLDLEIEYYIVMRTINGSIMQSYGWIYEYNPPNTYANGSFFESLDGGDVWNEYPDNDFCFKTYGLL